MMPRASSINPRVLPRALYVKRTRGIQAKSNKEFAGVPPAHRVFASGRCAPARHPGSGRFETPPPLALRRLISRSRGASHGCQLDRVWRFD